MKPILWLQLVIGWVACQEELGIKIEEIFGKSSQAGGYGGTDELLDTIESTLAEQNSLPNDYVEPQTSDKLVDHATVEVNDQFENCAEYTEQYGYECVPYYQCHNGTIITDGTGLIDIRNGFGSLTPEDSKCPGFLDVCCKDPDFIPPPPPKLQYAPKCGQRNQNGLGVRIQGFQEEESQFGEWPHMCAILHEKPVEQEAGYSGEPETINLYQCGGSLIAPGVILTAAHCVDKFEGGEVTQLKIRCGEWDTQTETEPYPHQDRYVEQMEIHPEYNAKSLINDVAVLFTSEIFNLSSHIDTVCLPHPDESFDEDHCFATGWGKDQFGSAGQYQVVLKEIDLPVVNNTECETNLRTTKVGKKFQLDDSFMCAGGINGKDTCRGDGGSPLVCQSKLDPQSYVQAGIVAWGVGCGEDKIPGVYASVSKAACWIDYVLSCNTGANSSVYQSIMGYSESICKNWLDNKIETLYAMQETADEEQAYKIRTALTGYQICNVQWLADEETLDLTKENVLTTTPIVSVEGSYGNPAEDLLKTAAHCLLPKQYGPCEAIIPKYYFDNDLKTCVSFNYGGCDGNENNFETEEECINMCAEHMTEIEDLIEITTDPILGDKLTKENELTTTNPPVSVEDSYGNPAEELLKTSAHCLLPKIFGPCEAIIPKYYFDNDLKTCQMFNYGGCDGNENNFDTEEECNNMCAEHKTQQLINPDTEDPVEINTFAPVHLDDFEDGVNGGYLPDDYVEPQTSDRLEDHATVEVNDQFENCAEYTEKYGYECVPYYQCHNGTIITDGAGLIDIRNGFGSLTPEDSKCPGFLDVCCKDPDFIPPPAPIVKHIPKCGQRHINGLGARIQGFQEDESQFGEWPHMCAILHEKPVEQEAGYSGEPQTFNLYQCGGSLIAPGVILTAAHCVDKFKETPGMLKIRCGEWDTQNETEPYAHQDRYVQSLEIHPEFRAKNLQNDFAVLFLAEEFVLSSHIDTMCLPDGDEVFDGETCFATGWGKDKFGSAGNYQVVLKEIDLPVVNYHACQDQLRLTRLGPKFQLHDSFTCAGGINGKDTCKGDGGSPLVCPSKYDPETYVQAGIVAWGIGCGEDGTPGVYASVSKAACWIDSVISCHQGAATGDYNSYFGYTSNVCQTWQDQKIATLIQQRDAAGKFGRIFEALIQKYQTCTVHWQAPAAPLVETTTAAVTEEPYFNLADFARDASNLSGTQDEDGDDNDDADDDESDDKEESSDQTSYK